MAMLQGDDRIDIRCTRGHYEAYVDEQFVVSGDTWTEVYNDLLEMGYLK